MNILVPKLFGFAKNRFCIFGTFFSVGVTLHVDYKKYKIFFLLFSVNTKYILSRELKTSEFSLVLRTSENYDVFNTLSIYLEKKDPLFMTVSH